MFEEIQQNLMIYSGSQKMQLSRILEAILVPVRKIWQ